ncbi:MAG: hypothetical protein WC464_03705 [Bdellovibrionales bacterium]
MAKFLTLLVAILFLCVPSRANATLVTFDDINVYGTSNVGFEIPFGYNGLIFTNIYAMDPRLCEGSPYCGGSYNGRVSPSNIASARSYGSFSYGEINSFVPFTLNGGAFSASYMDTELVIVGYLDNVVIYNDTFAISAAGPTFVTLNWSNIDRVFISSNNGGSIVIDNLMINEVPIPAVLPLFGGGLMALGGLRLVGRKRKA